MGASARLRIEDPVLPRVPISRNRYDRVQRDHSALDPVPPLVHNLSRSPGAPSDTHARLRGAPLRPRLQSGSRTYRRTGTGVGTGSKFMLVDPKPSAVQCVGVPCNWDMRILQAPMPCGAFGELSR